MKTDGKDLAARYARTLDVGRTEDKEEVDMPTSYIRAIFAVGLNPGVPVTELGKMLGFPQGSTSRIVYALSDFVRLNEPGLGFLEAVQDPVTRNRKRVFLTPKGRKYIEEVLSIMAGEPVTFETHGVDEFLASVRERS